MMQVIVLSILILTFLFILLKKEETFANNDIGRDEVSTEEEEVTMTEEETETEEIEKAIYEQLQEIPKHADLVLKKTYENFSPNAEIHESIDFTETSDKMVNRNANIPLVNPYDIKPFPCRKNEHTWDYTGVHKIEKPTATCRGVNSALTKRPDSMFFHPVNYNL